MNYKRVLGLSIYVIILSILFVSYSYAFGVAPSREIIPADGLSHEFTVRILNPEGKALTVALSPTGELAPYTTLSTSTLSFNQGELEKSFTYRIDLPNDLTAGQHGLAIIIIQVPSTTQSGGTVSAGLITTYELKVDVPYDGAFADGTLTVSHAMAGEPTVFTLSLINRGEEPLDVVADIIIKGPTNEPLDRFTLGQTTLQVHSSGKIESTRTNTLNPGEYIAEAIIQYNGKTTVLRKTFYSGTMSVDIHRVDTANFKLGTVAKFNLLVENKWNQPVNDLYAEVYIVDDAAKPVGNYTSSHVAVTPFGLMTIPIYWDTQDARAGTYDVRVVLHYAGKTTERVFAAIVGVDSMRIQETVASGAVTRTTTAPSGESKYSLIIILLIVVIVINIGWFVYFKFLKKTP